MITVDGHSTVNAGGWCGCECILRRRRAVASDDAYTVIWSSFYNNCFGGTMSVVDAEKYTVPRIDAEAHCPAWSKLMSSSPRSAAGLGASPHNSTPGPVGCPPWLLSLSLTLSLTHRLPIEIILYQ